MAQKVWLQSVNIYHWNALFPSTSHTFGIFLHWTYVIMRYRTLRMSLWWKIDTSKVFYFLSRIINISDNWNKSHCFIHICMSECTDVSDHMHCRNDDSSNNRLWIMWTTKPQLATVSSMIVFSTISFSFSRLRVLSIAIDIHGKGTKHSWSRKTNRIINNLVTPDISLFKMMLSNEVHNTTYCSIEKLLVTRV